MIGEYRKYYNSNVCLDIECECMLHILIYIVNGEREWLNCRNSSKDEILKWIELLKTQNGPSSAMRLRKMWHTNVPSVQGSWTPFLLRSPENSQLPFPNSELSIPTDVEESATEKLIKLFKEQQMLSNVKESAL